MTRTLIALAATALVGHGPLASAMPVLSFDADASEWSSATAPVPGVILPIGGSGQVNGNFTLLDDPDTGIQIGLRANDRFSPVPLPNVDADYTAQAGESGPGLTTWNYDVHIDFRGTGFSLGDFEVSVLTSFANHSTPDLQTALETAFVLAPGTLDGVELYQTSQNPGFFGSGIDPFATGVETLALTLTPKSGVSASPLGVDITVQIIPEPSAAILAVGGLAAACGMRRRR